MTPAQLRSKKLLKIFYENICLTLSSLAKEFNCSKRSIQRSLSKVGYYCSFTHNSKWYVLRSIPAFDERGIWFYNDIGFSKKESLTNTIMELVKNSPQGLTAKAISDILKSQCHPVLTRMHDSGHLDRISSPNGYIYLSIEMHKGKEQQKRILQNNQHPLPSDADAVKILVNLIKNPDLSANDLGNLLGKTVSVKSIIRLIQYHDLEKKTQTI